MLKSVELSSQELENFGGAIREICRLASRWNRWIPAGKLCKCLISTRLLYRETRSLESRESWTDRNISPRLKKNLCQPLPKTLSNNPKLTTIENSWPTRGKRLSTPKIANLVHNGRIPSWIIAGVPFLKRFDEIASTRPVPASCPHADTGINF